MHAPDILVYIRGDLLAQAAQLLPPAGSDQPPTRTSVVEHDLYGPVEVTHELYSYKHRRNRYWAWGPLSAVQLDDTRPRPQTAQVSAAEPPATDWRGMPVEPGTTPASRRSPER